MKSACRPFVLLMLLAASPVMAQPAAVESSPPTEALGPCPVSCSDKDAQRLQSAFQSGATRPHQKRKMLEFVRRHTFGSRISWQAAAQDYFKWRRSDEQRFPQASFANNTTTSPTGASPVLTQSTAPSRPAVEAAPRNYAAEQAEFAGRLAAARAGDNASFIKLFRYYRAGWGVGKDEQKAIFWLKKAELNRVPESYFELSYMHQIGWGVPQDFQKSFDYARLFKNAGGTDEMVSFLNETLKSRVGGNAFACLRYGFLYQTPQFAQCNLQIDQAQQQAALLSQQAAINQKNYEFQRMLHEQQLLEARQAKELAQKEQEARERSAASQKLLEISADLLCPKVRRGVFAEPVAGCGRNKHVPPPPTVNVFVQQPSAKYCGATAAGRLPC